MFWQANGNAHPYDRTIIAMNPYNDNSSSNESLTLTPVKKERHVILDENITLALTPFTLKLYLIFRYESDYRSECSSINKKVKFFMNKSGMSRGKFFECMNELEEHGLIKRETKKGEQSKYWIADKYNYFKPKEVQSSPVEEAIDQPPVQNMDGVVQNMDGVVQQVDTIINNSFNNSSQLKPIVDFQSTNYKDDEIFQMFYEVYPNKQKPEIARKAFYKAYSKNQSKLLLPEFALMLRCDVEERHKNNWKFRDKSKIPFPATYLNGSEWEGEIFTPEENVTQFPAKNNRYTMTELMEGVL